MVLERISRQIGAGDDDRAARVRTATHALRHTLPVIRFLRNPNGRPGLVIRTSATLPSEIRTICPSMLMSQQPWVQWNEILGKPGSFR